MADETWDTFFEGIITVNDVIFAILVFAAVMGLIFVSDHFWWKKYGK